MASSSPTPTEHSTTTDKPSAPDILMEVEIAIGFVAVAVFCLTILAICLCYINRSTKRQLKWVQEELQRSKERRRSEKEQEKRDLFPSLDSGCSQGQGEIGAAGSDSNQQADDVFHQESTTERHTYDNQEFHLSEEE